MSFNYGGQIAVEMARDEIRAKYGDRCWAEIIEAGKKVTRVFDSIDDAKKALIANGQEPLLDSKKVDGNYAPFYLD